MQIKQVLKKKNGRIEIQIILIKILQDKVLHDFVLVRRIVAASERYARENECKIKDLACGFDTVVLTSYTL